MSLAFARAGKKFLPRFGTSMLVFSGVASDLDYASYFGGASAFLRFHRMLLHSLPCAAALAAAIAYAFYALNRKRPPRDGQPSLHFGPAFAVCAVGVAGHVLLDLFGSDGLQLFWPFRTRWSALDLVANLDPWILVILIAGILLPQLFRLVSEEIGDRRKGSGAQRGAIVTLVLVAAYLGARADLHSRAVDLLLAQEFHGRAPLEVGAFPSSSAPLDWRGVVSTDNAIEEVDISLAPGAGFDPDRTLTRYKPEDSPALETGQRTRAAARFLTYARFPLASVVGLENGYRFELRDLRFASNDSTPANIVVRVDFDSSLHVREEEFRFAASGIP
jgi:inner membrane protein